jgi:hypothetical protein
MGWALEAGRAKQLDPAARSVLQAIAYHANGWGRSWPGVDTLIADTGWSRKTVSRAVASIEEAGVVETERRPGWTTLWIFPPEARLKLSTARSQSPGELSTAGSQSPGGRDSESRGRDSESRRGVTGTRESVKESVKESGGGAQSYPQPSQKPTFLPGTGWVEPYGDGAA